MSDPYKILGVARDADEAAIRTAYRKLAKRYHPDLNPGKPEMAEKFKAVASANDILADPEKRARYDRGEIDGTGAETPAAAARRYQEEARSRAGAKYQAAGFDPGDFADLFSRRVFRDRQPGPSLYSLSIGFLEAANGAKRRLTLPDARVIDVQIPAGIEEGSTLRIAHSAGEVLIEISITPHRLFHRDGKDILIELPVSLKEALLGAKVQVPTITGRVALAIPPHSSTGTKLRLKGRGINGGNQLVTLKVVLPTKPEPELEAFLATWEPKDKSDPRAGIEGG